MRTLAFSLCLSLQLSLSVAQAQEFDKQKAIAEAKEVTQIFAGALKTELVAAMQSGGPLNALGVCNLEAMPITDRVTSESNAEVSRVSLKHRNPKNAPNDWQRTVLEEFDTRAANGEDIEKMASVTTVEKDGKTQVRFMKALPTGSVCLSCHGEQLGTDVTARLDELYPDDKATGYSLGQVRGAIVVVKDYE